MGPKVEKAVNDYKNKPQRKKEPTSFFASPIHLCFISDPKGCANGVTTSSLSSLA
jgi:hypothetical protein